MPKGRNVKKILLTTTALIALGMAPAIAADLAARPYTKAPPMAVAVYNWSGFYAGVNGGWGSSRNRWDETSLGVALSEGSHDATGGTVGGQIGYRWQAASWVFGVEAQGNWADFHGSNVIPLAPAFTNDTRVDAFGLFTGQVGYAANNVLFYLKGGAAVTSDRYRVLAPAPVSSSPTASMTPVGVAWSALAWNMASLRTGRPASNTITCSCRTRPITS